jgi:pilus assembly protein CpaB
MLEEIKIPKKYLQPGVITRMEAALDRSVKVPVLSGTQIVEAMFVGDEDKGLAEKVPKNKRAFSIAVSDVTAVANLIQPGDYVDLLVTIEVGSTNKEGRQISEEILTKTIQENILVLAVNRISSISGKKRKIKKANARGNVFSAINTTSPKAREKLRTLTLSLTPEEVQRVNLAQEIGSMAVSLRSRWDDGKTNNLKALNPQDMLGIDKKIIQKSNPAWLEIRGAEQKLYR